MNYIIYAIPAFFILIAVEFFISRWRNVQKYRFNDALANINCGVVQQVTNVVFYSFLFLAYLVLYDNWRLMDIPNNIWTWILLFLCIDFLYYWFHRYSHEINAFWGAHIVHHQSEDYNLSVALRQSAFQVFVSTVFYLPLAIIGFDPYAFITINSLQTLYQFWIHTELIDKLAVPIEYIFSTPSHHRVHHGRNPEYIDKNHGGTLIIWDRMFGTFEPEVAPVVYGVTKPLNSWNPIWANLDYYRDLWLQMKTMDRWYDRLVLWLKKPGWRPAYLGGMMEVPQVQRGQLQKYNASASIKKTRYIGLQFVLMLGVALYFLSYHQTLTAIQMYLLLCWILLSCALLGWLVGGRAVAFKWEIFRWSALLLLLWWIGAN